MGLLTSVNNITYQLNDQKKKKQESEKQKIRKQNIVNELYDLFDTYFEESENINITTLKLIKNRDLVIREIKKSYFQEYEVKLTNNNLEFLKQNYIRILNNARKIYQEEEKIKIKQQKEAERIEKQKQKELKEAEKLEKQRQKELKEAEKLEKQRQKELKEAEKLQKQNEIQTETLSIGSIIGGVAVLAGIIVFLPLLFCLFVISAALKNI